jgi:hypothetical protein
VVVKVRFSNVGLTRWYEYAIRFVLGGVATVITGIIGKQFGPVIGGLFLAIPSILYATATLIRKHETEKKKEHGVPVGERAEYAVAVDTLGTALGGFGLIAFAVAVWKLLKTLGLVQTLCVATFTWIVIGLLTWMTWRFVRNSLRPQAQR